MAERPVTITPKMSRFVQLLLTPDEHGHLPSEAEVCREVGIAPLTPWRWKQKPEFVTYLQAEMEARAALAREAWAKRREEIRESDWRDSAMLRKRVREILEDEDSFMRFKVHYGRDGSYTETKELLTGAAITGLELASKLARLAAEMETERTKTETTHHLGAFDVDFILPDPDDPDVFALEAAQAQRLREREALARQLRGGRQLRPMDSLPAPSLDLPGIDTGGAGSTDAFDDRDAAPSREERDGE